MQVIPAIDLRGGRCVRLVQGDYGREVRYDLDPVEVARGWVRAGATLLHVVDLDAARDGGRRNAALITEIVRGAGVAVEVGGGLRSEADVDEVLAAGASFAIVGTLAAERPEVLPALVARFGPRVVLGLDAREGVVAVRGWERSAGVSALDLARAAAAAGVVRCIYTEVARDGTFSGPDVEGGARLQREAGLRVTLSGGVGTVEHLRAAAAAGLDACIVGRALLEGRLTLEHAFAAAREAAHGARHPEAPIPIPGRRDPGGPGAGGPGPGPTA